MSGCSEATGASVGRGRRTSLRRGGGCALLASLLAGCEGGDGGEAVARILSARDSAGVRIVELSDLYRDSLPRWTIAAEPTLSIGGVHASGAQALHDVSGATRLPDGGIAVANRGSGEVRVFAADGTHLRAFGGTGRGPGEFVALDLLRPASGDTLVAFDSRLRRVTRFTAGGDHIDSWNLQPWLAEPSNPTRAGVSEVVAVGALPGGVLARSGYLRRSGEGEYRDSFALSHVRPDGTATELGRFPGTELFFLSSPSGMFAAGEPIFARQTYVAAEGARVVVGSSDEPALQIFGAEGLEMRIGVGARIEPATEPEIERWRQHLLDSASRLTGEFGTLVRTLIARAPARAAPGAFGGLALGRDGTIWIAEPERVPGEPVRWIALAADGTPRGRIEIPAGDSLLEIGADYLLVLGRDELDVEQVVLQAVRRE